MSIELQNCNLSVRDRTLLEDIDLRIDGGSLTSVIGANGAGKTTLLRLAAGEMYPGEGQVLMDDSPLARLDREERARRVAVLPQRSMLDFPFLVSEVLEMGRIPHMTGKLLNAGIVDEVIDVMALGEFRNRVYTTLSGGEQQRVQIGRVLCQLWDRLPGGFLLFDEPTAPLDLAHQLSFLSLAKELADRGAGVLLVLHDINLAARFSDQVVLIAEGKILKRGNPAEVLTNEYIKAGFGVEVELVQREGGRPPLIVATRTSGTTVKGK